MESLNESYNVSCSDCIKSEPKTPFVNFVWYITLSCLCLVFLTVLIILGRMIQIGQKTRNSQQRRAYMGSRQRPSDTQTEPTIYVSPANLPPPPKYEAMAPPSYEEVVGIHYPNYQPPVQPITQPITTALAQSSNSTPENNNANNVTRNNDVPATVITVNADERTTVTVATS